MPCARVILSITAGLLGSLPVLTRASEPRLPDQVVVLRAPPSTVVRVRHQPGDIAARLEVENPPSGTLETLGEQRGPFVRAVEPVELREGTLEILLRLSTDAVRIEARRLRKPSGWSVLFTPKLTPPFPPLSDLVGHLPGLVPPPARPVLFPSAPRDTPCTGNPDADALLAGGRSSFSSEVALERVLGTIIEPTCRSWTTAQIAARALSRNHDLSPFERWAFLFTRETEGWELHPEAHAQAALVAVEVLGRTGYYPEAEALLASSERYETRHAPYRAMALANLFAARARHDEAETLYRQLVAEGFEPWMIYQASLGRALNALEGGDALGALAHVEQAGRLISQTESLPGDLWVVGGEAGIATEELALARSHFERAAKCDDAPTRALGFLRLADLEARVRRRQSALEGWSVAQAVGMPCVEDLVHLRRVLALEGDRRETMGFLEGQASFSRCPAVRMESSFALARIHLGRGEELLALRPALAIVEEGVSRWGPARPHRKMITAVAGSAIERFSRSRDPAGLVEFYEEHLERFAHLLEPRSRLLVGRAYDAIGASLRGADELLRLLTDFPELPFRETLVLDLGDALLRAGDLYRTDLLLRHLDARHNPGELPWRREGLAGRYELAKGRPGEALGHLLAAVRSAPAGDPRDRLHRDLAQARLAGDDVLGAARALAVAARVEATPRSALHSLAIDILSECARTCSTRELASAARSIFDPLGRDFVTPRLTARLARRGALDALAPGEAPTSSTPELWSRLDALGITPTGRAPTAEEEER